MMLTYIYPGIKLFGHGYSGLEYDYRGLIRLYHETRNMAQELFYIEKLNSWSDIRDLQEESLGDPLQFIQQEKEIPSDFTSPISQSSELHPFINGSKSLLELISLDKTWHHPIAVAVKPSDIDDCMVTDDIDDNLDDDDESENLSVAT